MPIGRVKAENIALFLIGISTVFIGNYFIYYFLAVNHPTHSHGYLVFGGVVFILAGIELMRRTYQIFIPLKKNSFESARTCPYCGAVVEEEATECEKCKRQFD